MGLIGLMCIRGRRRQTTKPTDDEDERNLIALSLIIHLWITLISKPTAENPTVEEVGGASSAEGGIRRRFPERMVSFHPLTESSFLFCHFEFASLESRGSSLWRVNEVSRYSQRTVMAEGTTQAHPGQMNHFLNASPGVHGPTSHNLLCRMQGDCTLLSFASCVYV